MFVHILQCITCFTPSKRYWEWSLDHTEFKVRTSQSLTVRNSIWQVRKINSIITLSSGPRNVWESISIAMLPWDSSKCSTSKPYWTFKLGRSTMLISPISPDLIAIYTGAFLGARKKIWDLESQSNPKNQNLYPGCLPTSLLVMQYLLGYRTYNIFPAILDSMPNLWQHLLYQLSLSNS